jgi:hypothetical protein
MARVGEGAQASARRESGEAVVVDTDGEGAVMVMVLRV